MMIDPETYYEENLKGKTAEQILKKIRGLKNEIGHLNNIVEHPEYEVKMLPDERTKIWCEKLYLDRAKEAYEEAGEIYRLSNSEKRAKEFEENVPFIEKIVLKEESFIDGFLTVICSVINDKVKVEIDKSASYLKPEPIAVTNCFEKTDFMRWLKEIRIGEWKKYYNANRFEEVILDGTEWELVIFYSNGIKPFKAKGYESYPYNFDKLKELLCEDE